jgi:hypothetical protein
VEGFQTSLFALWAVEGGFGLSKTTWGVEGFRSFGKNTIVGSGGVEKIETLPQLCRALIINRKPVI